MSLVLLIKNIDVQNANAIAGLTYGFPAITHFLGFVHNLSRSLPEDWGVSLDGVGVVCHNSQIHAKRPSQYADYVFALTRNPLTKAGATAAFNEEGRMNMCVSLVIEIQGLNVADEFTAHKLEAWVNECIGAKRLAGGQIVNQPQAKYYNCNDNLQKRKLLRALMPGFVLVDRFHYLNEHHEACLQERPEATLLESWSDFAAIRYRAQKLAVAEGEEEKIEWQLIKKIHAGYLVPIMCGYCAISPLYEAGEVEAVRDATVPAIFAEAAYGVAEWLSPHRIFENFDSLFWRYKYQSPWYVASTEALPELELDIDEDTPFEPY